MTLTEIDTFNVAVVDAVVMVTLSASATSFFISIVLTASRLCSLLASCKLLMTN